jgi:NhaP-type Na+/H+ or K+/H+ antiporter
MWFFLVGVLLLSMGLLAPVIKRLPVTSAIIYLTVGLLFGPTGLGLYHFNPLQESALLEILTEAAVLISLYAAGVKMPIPMTLSRWKSPIRLAFISMTVTVTMVALFGYYILELPLGAAILLGAIVAPTDPVLATDVQIRHPGDRDLLRFTLTCEAGMNDGSAFPFVMLGLGLLGLHELGDFGASWIAVDLIWATFAGIGIGVIAGNLIARIAAWLRNLHGNFHLLDDFVGLGLISGVYGFSVLVNAWGFLAVFAAAVAMRQTEVKLARQSVITPCKLQSGDIAPDPKSNTPRHVSESSLVFKEHLERLSEVVLILLVGGTLFLDSWSWRAIGLTLFLFVLARPLSVIIGLLGTRTPWRIRGLAGWFGVRGIGSLYYLMYAIQHGLPEELGLELIHLTLVVVTLSILVHGISVKPMIARFWATRHETPRNRTT